jgi:sulfur carrier protein ThiS
MISIVGRKHYTTSIGESMTVAKVAEMLQIREASYVYIKNGNPVTSDEVVTPDDDLKFLEIFSGG